MATLPPDSDFSANCQRRLSHWRWRVSAVIGANWRAQVLAGTATLSSLRLPAGLLVVLILLIFFLPLLIVHSKTHQGEEGRQPQLRIAPSPSFVVIP